MTHKRKVLFWKGKQPHSHRANLLAHDLFSPLCLSIFKRDVSAFKLWCWKTFVEASRGHKSSQETDGEATENEGVVKTRLLMEDLI